MQASASALRATNFLGQPLARKNEKSRVRVKVVRVNAKSDQQEADGIIHKDLNVPHPFMSYARSGDRVQTLLNHASGVAGVHEISGHHDEEHLWHRYARYVNSSLIHCVRAVAV